MPILSIYKKKINEKKAREAVLYYQNGFSLRAVGKLVGKSYGWVHLVVKEKLYGDKYKEISE